MLHKSVERSQFLRGMYVIDWNAVGVETKWHQLGDTQFASAAGCRQFQLSNELHALIWIVYWLLAHLRCGVMTGPSAMKSVAFGCSRTNLTYARRKVDTKIGF